MKLAPRWKRMAVGFGCAATLTPVAVFCTASFAAFRSIPWTLPYLVIAFVAEVGGVLPALLSGLISLIGVYLLVISPSRIDSHDPDAWWKVGAFIFTAFFITYLVRQRSLAMRSLQTSEAHYRSVTETASDVVVTIDENSRILSVNPAVMTVFGYAPEDLIGKDLITLVPESHAVPHLAGVSRTLRAKHEESPEAGFQLTGLRKDGQVIPLEVSFAAHESDGQSRFTGFIRDISERQKTQAALIQGEKLAAVGRLASSIAHEINNPLEAVTNLLYIARHSDDLAEAMPFLETADVELRRASAITAQTLRFHKQSTRPTAVTYDQLMAGILTGQHSRLHNGNVSVAERKRALQAVLCFEGEIRQVLRNLIGNALDAMHSSGGTLFLRGREGHDWRTGRPGLLIMIADDGTGMSQTTKTKLFDAFYTTKGIGGTGLGMWISKEIVERHDGRIMVRTNQTEGHSGTVFTLFLPFDAVTRQRSNF